MRNSAEAQAAIDALRRDLVGICWWCGGTADSREHKYKMTDLDRLAGGDKLYWGGEGGGKELQGYKRSDTTRFRKVLCQRCNNAGSQPFDRAYERYSDHITSHLDQMWEWDGIPFDEVYGGTWESDIQSLARYFVKNFGCLMADNGLQPPQTLRDFLDGSQDCMDVGMYIMKDEALWLLHKKFRADGLGRSPGLWIDPGYGWAARDGSRLDSYAVTTFLGYIGIHFDWTRDSGHKDSFYFHARPVLNQRKASREIKHMLSDRRR